MKTILSVLLSGLLTIPALGQVPLLNSSPTDSATIYLDFDGQYVTGTIWNWGGPINALPAALGEAEITEIFKRVSEDYRIFNINITTDSTVYLSAPVKKRIRVIVTPTSAWYPVSAGGVSLVNTFTWGDGTPSWVFSAALGNTVKKVAEACSHEAGHTLGLQHQSVYNSSCGKTSEYSGGQGSGEIGWAPIMGVGYSRNMTTWHTGTSTVNCSTIQNDIDTIARVWNGFGLRSDDHSDTYTSATDLNLTVINFTAEGMINNLDDRDVFKFNLTSSTNFRLNAIPQNVGAGNNGANVDIRVGLINPLGDTVGRYNPSDLLNAGVDTNLNAGTYYIVVEGVGNINMPDYGSVGSYGLAGMLDQVLPIHQLSLTGRIADDLHSLSWNFKADEPVKKINLEVSKDGAHFSTLSELGADARSFSWKPTDNNSPYHYRIKTTTVADERAYYSNIAVLRSAKGKTIDLLGTVVKSHVLLNTQKSFSYQLLDESGRLLQNGTLQAGTNRIEIKTLKKGLLLLRVQDGTEAFTYKLIRE